MRTQVQATCNELEDMRKPAGEKFDEFEKVAYSKYSREGDVLHEANKFVSSRKPYISV
jgi:hypothetical protein